jgi:hypothetical protein
MSASTVGATITYVQPSAVVTHAAPEFALSYVSIAVEALMDTTGRYKKITDSALATETAILTLAKQFYEAYPAIDVVSLAISKSVSPDSVTTSDGVTILLTIVRNFTDNITSSDSTPVILFSPTYVDTSLLSEVVSAAFAKLLSESLTATEVASLSFEKGTVTETLSLSESFTQLYNLNPIETISESETLVFVVDKTLQDGVGVNDIFSFFDGLDFTFDSGVNNVAFAADSISFQNTFLRGFSETVSLSEDTTFFTDKSVSETLTASDVFTPGWDYNREHFDTISVSESTAIDFTVAPFADLVVNSDASTIEFVQAPVSETLSAGDVAVVETFFPRDFLDTVGISDSSVILFLRPFSDTIAQDDSLVVDFAAGKADTATVAESASVFLDKPLSDSVALADGGLIIIQDYCDLTYFESDYVGISFPF